MTVVGSPLAPARREPLTVSAWPLIVARLCGEEMPGTATVSRSAIRANVFVGATVTRSLNAKPRKPIPCAGTVREYGVANAPREEWENTTFDGGRDQVSP